MSNKIRSRSSLPPKVKREKMTFRFHPHYAALVRKLRRKHKTQVNVLEMAMDFSTGKNDKGGITFCVFPRKA